MLAVMWLAAILAAVVHVLIFCMESLWWTTPKVRARFRQAPEQADATKLFAFNQGFYNLFPGHRHVRWARADSVRAHGFRTDACELELPVHGWCGNRFGGVGTAVAARGTHSRNCAVAIPTAGPDNTGSFMSRAGP